ncbi:MAG: hypothetical protein R3C61_25145 [Bacteroidia bacterium]
MSIMIFLANTSYTYHSAWYLKEVKHPNEGMGKITFDYGRDHAFYPGDQQLSDPIDDLYDRPRSGRVELQPELCGGTAPSTNSASSTVATITNRRFIKEAKFFQRHFGHRKTDFHQRQQYLYPCLWRQTTQFRHDTPVRCYSRKHRLGL